MDTAASSPSSPHRARDFARDLRCQSRQPGGRHAWPLVLSSLRASFRQGLAAASPNADLNGRIATAILSCFPAELFDSTGQFRSLWLLRLSNATSDAQGMIAELLSPEPAPPVGREAPAAVPARGEFRR